MKKLLVTFMVALFATVVWGQTQTELKPSALQVCVTTWVTQNMKGFNIDKAFKIDSKGVITYNVRAIKEKETQWFEFSSDCSKVKKIPVPVTAEKGPVVNPTPAPKPKPVPPKTLPVTKPK